MIVREHHFYSAEFEDHGSLMSLFLEADSRVTMGEELEVRVARRRSGENIEGGAEKTSKAWYRNFIRSQSQRNAPSPLSQLFSISSHFMAWFL